MPRAKPEKTTDSGPRSLRDGRVWRALRKPFRWRLFEAVRACGGVSAQDLARRVGISSQLMLYHLQLLEAAGLLVHERGRRASGKGGKFRAAERGISIALPSGDRTEARRFESILEELDGETRALRRPQERFDASHRWERLTPDEARRVAAAFAQVHAILDAATARREKDASVPDATHVVAMRVQAVADATLPSPTWCAAPRSRRRTARRG
jgi:predicted ArsR family transcriptional regulator